MSTKTGNVFLILGGLFVLIGVFLYKMNSLDTPFGTIFLNLILFTWDCLWLIGTGLYLLTTGFQVQKMKPIKTIELKVCGYLSAFNINFIIFSFIFNLFGESLVQTNGRIFTYCLQSVGRIIQPSFSADFFVPFTGFVFFIVIIVLFRRGYKTDDLNRQ